MVVVGTALMFAPAAMGLSPAPLVTGVIVGILAIALGLAGTDDQGRGILSLSAQAFYDRGLALGLLVAGVIFGLNGEPAALAFFGGAGVATLVLASTTSYSTARA
jgi:hypothetical protein